MSHDDDTYTHFDDNDVGDEITVNQQNVESVHIHESDSEKLF